MIRQAHTYLAGAVSGTALIAAAAVAFVLLVSAQAIRDWPLGGLGFGGGDSASVAPVQTGALDAAAGPGAGGAADAKAADDRAGSGDDDRGAGDLAGGSAPGTVTSSPGPDTPTSTGAAPGSGGGSAGSAATPSASGGDGGSKSGGLAKGGGGSSPSETVAGTVNGAVTGVDEVSGGAVGGSGIGQATEGVVNETVGPESAVGQTVDEAAETVGGLLGGSH